MRQLIMRSFLLVVLLIATTAARASTENPYAVSFHQRLGDLLPVDVTLVDDAGRSVLLSEMTRERPALLLFGYFRCRRLCGVLRDDVLATLGASGAAAGQDYELLALSLDPEETPADAVGAKAVSMTRFPTAGAQQHWRFLTGSSQAITRLAEAAGLEFVYDKERRSFAHPLGVVVTTPPGRVSGYLLGLDSNARKMRDMLARAAAGEIAKPAAPALLLCFDFDPMTGRYTLSVIKALRISVIGFVLAASVSIFHVGRQKSA